VANAGWLALLARVGDRIPAIEVRHFFWLTMAVTSKKELAPTSLRVWRITPQCTAMSMTR
jgi:hypothetical protein